MNRSKKIKLKMDSKKRQRANHNMSSRHLTCCECGCQFDPSSRFHYHHTMPTPPEQAADLPDFMKSKATPSAGPEALLDVAKECEDGKVVAPPVPLAVGDLVKLCFLITDRQADWLPPHMRHIPKQVESEPMWVIVTGVDRDGADITCTGELRNVPVLISPAKLQFGSTVTFETRHVYSFVEVPSHN